MDNKELIRRALLGNKKSQEECTAKGIALPCPCCCASVDIVCVPAHEHKILDLPAYQGGCFIECTGCTYAISGENKKEVLKAHNTRPAPPIGRCGECKHFNHFFNEVGHCMIHSQEKDLGGEGYCVEMLKTDFCNYFEPRED